jgi:hypothetical protein
VTGKRPSRRSAGLWMIEIAFGHMIVIGAILFAFGFFLHRSAVLALAAAVAAVGYCCLCGITFVSSGRGIHGSLIQVRKGRNIDSSAAFSAPLAKNYASSGVAIITMAVVIVLNCSRVVI